jgi:hypothetical protein
MRGLASLLPDYFGALEYASCLCLLPTSMPLTYRYASSLCLLPIQTLAALVSHGSALL